MSSSTTGMSGTSYVTCHCGEVAPIRVSTTAKNPGRRFFGCKKYGEKGCGFFEWVDKQKTLHDEITAMYQQMDSLTVTKEDLRAVNEGLKELNEHLMSKVDYEKKKREELRNKYDECKKELNYTKKWGLIVVLALCFALIYSRMD